MNKKNLLKNLVVILIAVFFIMTIMSVLGIPKGFRIFTVMSGSMEPAVTQGSVIFVIPQEEYQNEDVITFEKTDNTSTLSTITHRVIDVKKDQFGQSIFVTKGDANAVQDMDDVYQDQIIGKKVLSIPFIGYPVSLAKTKVGVILLVLLPAIILSFLEFRKLAKELPKRETLVIKKKDNFKYNSQMSMIVICLALLLLTGFTYSKFVDVGKVKYNELNTTNWVVEEIIIPANTYLENVLPTAPSALKLIEAEEVIVTSDNGTTDNN